MNEQSSKTPEHQAIYDRLRHMILFGEVLPGQALTILGLKTMLGAGMTPVREAIRRLTAEGALEALGNRRICVPNVTQETLNQIYFARLAIEPRLGELAVANITKDQLKTLAKLDEQVDAAISAGDINGYLAGNYRFHFTLYDAANAPVLRNIASSLWLQLGPSLRVVSGRYGTQNLPDEHKDALSALKAKDGAGVARAIEADIRQGLSLMR
ncbi:GntR family transcriptional regulator [Aestuariibius sp. HNIBRBA575]|uniref:GntR family transcriptional regulator n=1 Tax=Aestuariibius sp. HNIBRBA575 TaxID=3233343 RepID=UPI0034A2FAB9